MSERERVGLKSEGALRTVCAKSHDHMRVLSRA